MTPEHRCDNCRYWVRNEANPAKGECRERSPQLHSRGWPITFNDDWCAGICFIKEKFVIRPVKEEKKDFGPQSDCMALYTRGEKLASDEPEFLTVDMIRSIAAEVGFRCARNYMEAHMAHEHGKKL